MESLLIPALCGFVTEIPVSEPNVWNVIRLPDIRWLPSESGSGRNECLVNNGFEF